MKKILSALLVYLLTVTPVFAQATLLPNAKQTFLDNNGNPLVAGTVTQYVPGTTNKKTTWIDHLQATANSNPLTLDSAGRAVIFGQGDYRQVVKDSSGNTIWDSFTSAIGSSEPAGATGTDTAPVGSVMAWAGITVPTNWALAYGQAVSRTTYSDLYDAIVLSHAGIGCTNLSTTLTGFADTSLIRVGAAIEATCLTTGVTVATIASSTSITVSVAASATSTVTAKVYNWGNGDGTSTFNVPDLRGRTFAGADAMGGTAASRLTTTYYGAAAGAPGQAGGSQSQTLTTAQMPAHTHLPPGFSVSTHTTSEWQAGIGFSGDIPTGYSNSTVTSSTGGGDPHSVVQPTITTNYIIKMAPNSTGAGGVISIGGMFGDIACDTTFKCEAVASVNTIGLATQATLTVLANVTGGTTQPSGATLTQWLDATCGSSRGMMLARGAATWGCVTPGVAGNGLVLSGSLDPTWAALPGTGTVTSVAMTVPSFLSVAGSPITTTGTFAVTLATQNANLVMAGPTSGAAATPTFRSLVSLDIPAALTLGVSGTTIGTLSLAGNTSGTVLITPQAAAGTPTLTLPTASGTFAVSATSPLVLSATTGALTCPTCTTSSGGGAVTGVAPVAVSGAGAVSITGAAGQVLAGAGPAFTATPTLGVAGTTVGTLAFANATSGSITLSPVAGALGTVTLTLPAATDTVAVLAASQAFTNKTYNGLTLTSTTGTFTLTNAKTLAVTNSLTISGTDGTTTTFPSTSATLAGLGITNAFTGANSFSGLTTWTGSLIVPMRTITAAGAVTVSATTDYFICLNKTVGAATAINLPGSPTTGLTYLIKDCKGDSATNNITVTPAAGNIDGSSTYVISTNYASVAVTYNGTSWFVN